MAQEMYPDGFEEVLATLGLFNRLVSFNKVICMVDFVMFQIYPYKLFKSFFYLQDVCYSLMNIGDSFHDKDITGYVKYVLFFSVFFLMSVTNKNCFMQV